ncbi:MAG: AEC family transporter [Dehalococcoidales bacterium]|nr:AEC family transporter [Dehalococcoidales bacterium]
MPGIIDVVTPAFFAILVGFLVGKLLKINMAPVVDLTLYVGVPALVFVSLMEKDIVLLDAAKIWSAALVIMAGCAVIAILVFKSLRQKHSGLYVAISMMNTVNLPFPIIYLAYGTEGLVVATLFYIPNIILMYSLGVYVMSGRHWKENVREVLRQPVVYASVLGLAFNFLKVPVPDLVINSLDFIAMMAIPLVLIVLGYNLSKVRIASFPTTLLASFLRIGVGLGLGLLMAWALDLTGLDRTVVILVSAMPAAAATSILATKYDNEPETVSSVVFLPTVASLGVIPVLLHYFG